MKDSTFNCFLHIAARSLLCSRCERVGFFFGSAARWVVGGRGRGGDNRKWRVFEGDGEDPTGSPGCSSKNNHLLTPITDLKRETDGLLLPEGEGRGGGRVRRGRKTTRAPPPSGGGALAALSPWPAWPGAGSARWRSGRWPGRPPPGWGTGSTGAHCGPRQHTQQSNSVALMPVNAP